MNPCAGALLACCLVLTGCLGNRVTIESTLSPYLDQHNATLVGDLRKPSGDGPFPAVVLMHGCAGSLYHPTYVARTFRRAGYATLVLDSFGPRGKTGGEVCVDSFENRAAVQYRVFDALHALVWLRSQAFVDPANIFLAGWSHGGAVATRLAINPRPLTVDGARMREAFPDVAMEELRFTALVSYYPGCHPGNTSDDITTPLLVLTGSADKASRSMSCRLTAMTAQGAPFEVVVYDGAHHAFDSPGPDEVYWGLMLRYDRAAANDSRKRMLEWFRRHRHTAP